jgi:acetoin utilization deacetylase AcuC-like enzyme
MKKVGFIYSEIYLKHENPSFHPESEERLRSIVQHINKSGLSQKLIHLEPRKAEEREILYVHDERYLDMLKNKGEGYLDPDTYKSNHSFEAACYAAGALLTAIDACKSGQIERAFCAVRPPGHHAERGAGMGFCLFNNIAVAARYAQNQGYERVFIIDFDVHHGNGTQHMFEEDNTVFYFSTHQYPHYPGTGSSSETGRGNGKGFTRNVPMTYGAGDKEYLEVYEKLVPQLMHDFAPSILLVSAGYDIHEKDPLSGIRVTTDGIRSIVRAIMNAAQSIPAIFTLEGGYNLNALGEGVAATIDQMLQ